MMLDRLKASLKRVIGNLLVTLGLNVRAVILPRFGKPERSDPLVCLVPLSHLLSKPLWRSARFSLGGLLRRKAVFPSGFA